MIRRIEWQVMESVSQYLIVLRVYESKPNG